MTSWPEQLQAFECDALFASKSNNDPHPFANQTWEPTDADKSAAWALYTELRTRITTQPLAYRHGDETTALTSVYNIFELTREAIKKHEGCTHFATLAVYVLNVHIRPFTAYWHRVSVAERLESSDASHQFRHNLIELQQTLRLFMRLLGHLAEGERFTAGTQSGFESTDIYQSHNLGTALPFGMAGSPLPIPNAAAIDESERREVLARRQTYDLHDEPEDAVGLALSGGGIRSATFSLGVTQYLARKGIIKQVDFLSTVSGGGYLGSFMSAFLNDPDRPEASLDLEGQAWPFGHYGDVESKAVRHLRNHSKYLAEGGFKTYALMVGLMFYGIAVNLLLTLPFVLLAVILAHYTLDKALIDAANGAIAYPPASLRSVTLLVAGLLLASAIVLPLIQNYARYRGAQRPKFKVFSSWYERWWCIGLFVLLAVLLLWNALPFGYWLYHGWMGGAAGQEKFAILPDKVRQGLLASVATLPFLTGALQFLASHKPLARRLVMILLTISGPLVFVTAFFVLTDYFTVPEMAAGQPLDLETTIWGLSRASALWFWFIVVALYGGLFLNINYSSPHRYYRRQLSRTYLRRAQDGTDETAHVHAQRLSDLNQRGANGESKAPYHLINCALNIPACVDPNLRGRASDFFVFSKHYCGSPIVGYAKTTEWEDLDGHLDLGTAMAISAAAAAPQMGVHTQSGISYLLAILNLRLNYWATPPRKPGHPGELRGPSWLLRLQTPGWWCFFKELTGLFMDENDRYLNLSDGGHIENLAIYELLRRRCKFIIAIDGEADPKRTFHGLLTLVRLAKIDLNVTIEPGLEELRADAKGDSRAHFLLCGIDYGQGQRGFLLYIKSSMTGNETEFLQTYRAEHPAFPHESTSDQFFDEAQFEAYRALGEHIGEELFRPELVASIRHGEPPLVNQPAVKEWFQRLADNLLAS